MFVFTITAIIIVNDSVLIRLKKKNVAEKNKKTIQNGQKR